MCSHVSAAVSEPVTAAIPPMGSLLSAEFPDPPVAAGESRASEVAGAGSMTPPGRVRAQRGRAASSYRKGGLLLACLEPGDERVVVGGGDLVRDVVVQGRGAVLGVLQQG